MRTMCGVLVLLMLNVVAVAQDAAKENKPGDHNQAGLDRVATGIMQKPIFKFAAKSVAYSPNGAWIAVGTGEGMIHLYSTQSEELVRSIPAHDNWAFDLVFTADSKRLWSGGGDNLTKVWDVASGESLATYEDHQEDVHGVALAGEESLLITGADDMQVLIRNLKTNSVAVLGEHDRQVTGIAVSPDGKLAASSSRDNTVKIWDIATREEKYTLKGHSKDVLAASFSKDSKRLVTTGNDQSAIVWNLETGQLMQRFEIGGWGHAAIFLPDDFSIVVGTSEGRLQAFRMGKPEAVALLVESYDIADLALAPGGNEIAVVTANGNLLRLQLTRIELPRQSTEKPPNNR